MQPNSVVFIENDQETISQVTDTLQGRGYIVYTASNATEGFKLATEVVPSIVLLNLNTPGTNGLEICKNIHTYPALEKTPIVLLTLREGKYDPLYSKLYGIVAFLKKPFDPDALMALMEEHCPYQHVDNPEAASFDAPAEGHYDEAPAEEGYGSYDTQEPAYDSQEASYEPQDSEPPPASDEGFSDSASYISSHEEEPAPEQYEAPPADDAFGETSAPAYDDASHEPAHEEPQPFIEETPAEPPAIDAKPPAKEVEVKATVLPAKPAPSVTSHASEGIGFLSGQEPASGLDLDDYMEAPQEAEKSKPAQKSKPAATAKKPIEIPKAQAKASYGPAKKGMDKKKMLIIGGVLLFVVVAAVGVAAFFLLDMGGKPEVVATQKPAGQKPAPALPKPTLPAPGAPTVTNTPVAPATPAPTTPAPTVTPVAPATPPPAKPAAPAAPVTPPPAKAPIKPAQAAPAQPAPAGNFVQFGAFGVKENALKLIAELKAKGIDGTISETSRSGKPLYRVILNETFASTRDAQNRAASVQKSSGMKAIAGKD